MARLSGPNDLASRLKLTRTPEQFDLMQKFMEPGRVLHSMMNVEHSRASALCMLYRLLAKEGSRGIVMAPRQDLAREFMGFMREITMLDPAVNSVCRWTRWSTLKIGEDSGHECRVLQNIQGATRGMQDATQTTLVVLAAGELDNPIFVENYTVLDAIFQSDSTKFICLW